MPFSEYRHYAETVKPGGMNVAQFFVPVGLLLRAVRIYGWLLLSRT